MELIIENEARKDEIEAVEAKNVKLEKMIQKSNEKVNALENAVKLLTKASEKDKVKESKFSSNLSSTNITFVFVVLFQRLFRFWISNQKRLCYF